MVKTASTMMKLETVAPPFSLPDVVSGNVVTYENAAGKAGLLVMFICRHCPFVIHVQDELARLGRSYSESGIGIVAISANDANAHPDDSPKMLAQMAQDLDLVFPLLHDESQEIAKSYTAACTPDFFLFNANKKLVYRGQLDDSRPGNEAPVDGRDLREAMDALANGRPAPKSQKPSLGCNIKWRPGNEPNYFG